jgi:tight adherence protein B
MIVDRARVLCAIAFAVCFLALWAAPAYSQTDDLGPISVDVTRFPEVALDFELPSVGSTWTARVIEKGAVRPARLTSREAGGIEVVLVIDTSGSMAGEPMDAAKAAAIGVVRELPPAARASIVGFGSAPYVVAGMTDDATALGAGIAGLQATGETALYDALVIASNQFSGEDVPRSVVLFSDGGDTMSTNTLADATSHLVGVRSRLFGLRLSTSETDDAALAGLADATSGRVVDAFDLGSVASTYREIAESALSHVRLTYTSVAGGVTPLTVEVVAGDVRRSSTLTVDLPVSAPPTTVAAVAPAPRPADAERAPSSNDASRLVIGGAGLFIGVALLAYQALVRPPKSLLAVNRQPVRRTAVRDLKGRFGVALERSLERRGRRAALGERLERAGIALRPGEYAASASVVAGLGAFCGLLIGGLPLAFICSVLVVVVAWLLLTVRTSKRRQAFERQLPDVLQQLTSSLRAGYGIMQALGAVARDVPAPAGDELRRVVHEVQLGRPLTESLDAMAARVEGQDFAWVVQAIDINREVGGDLVEVLDAVASTIRARAQLRREIKTLSAQGRLSARFLIAMPFALGAVLSAIRPGYLSPLFEPGAGPVLLGMGAVMITIGWLWLRSIVRLRY